MATIVATILEGVDGLLPLVKILIIALIIVALFNFILVYTKRSLLQRAKTRIQVSNIKILARIVNIGAVVMVFAFAFLSYIRSWTGISVLLGLITAALGFALQRPITGVAAWFMVVFKRPFRIGDRITIGNITGDVYDISLAHLYIDEVGGDLETQQHSGRNVLVPNYRLFEENIINHTLMHDYILCEVAAGITYESNIDKAVKLIEKAAKELAGKYGKEIKKDVSVRLSFEDSYIKMRVMFFAPVQQSSKIKSDITKRIYDIVMKEKDVAFAYPHTTLLFDDKDRKKRKRFRKI